MMRASHAGICVVLALLAPAQQRIAGAPASCESLSSLQLPNATVTSATVVAAGAFTPPSATPARGMTPPVARAMAAAPAFCRVAVTSRPTADSDIKIEVWLPATMPPQRGSPVGGPGGWNGKLLAVGNGGWAGTISYPALAGAIALGYAGASTDTGHSTPGASFAVGHPEKLADFAHRSLHEMAVTAKAVTAAYYGDKIRAAIWNGCSTGGNQGLTLASMYPHDFDAIVAGASPDPRARLHGVRLLVNRIVHRTPGSYIPPQKYPVIHKAVMDACDATDGVKDGVLESPMSCRFDPNVLACKGADGPACLTPEQVETARALVADVKHPRTGPVLYPPLLVPGSELMWGTLAGPEPFAIAVDTYRHLVAKDPAWNPTQLDPDTAVELADTALAPMNTVSPNLKPFFARGGKLLMYHGWNDQQVPASSSISYYQRVIETVGKGAAGKSIQLYMVPGMNHCQGGVGTDTFDKLAAIEQWMAKGTAPSQIIASHATDGKIDRTRPLCPYPQVAVYKGTGNTNDAANFACRNPR